MVAPIIECIPNLSEGKDQKKLALLVSQLKQIPYIDFRHITSDPDHHRSVLTFLGGPGAIKQAVMTIYDWALELIDMKEHQGVHPRIGAVDVIPLVPIEGISESECIGFSRSLAQEIASKYQVPIFLYEKSAIQTQRRNLAHIRRSQFEKLSIKMQQEEWQPDFGPLVPHPQLGATALGVRNILVAFNVNLASQDLALARTIAREIRESNGGVPGVKALGIELKGKSCVQVSMNIVEPDKVSLYQLIEIIREKARRADTLILNTEIIGLIPERFLLKTALSYLKPEYWQDQQLLKLPLKE